MSNFINTLLLVLLGILTNNIVFFAIKESLKDTAETPGFVSIVPLIIYAVYHQRRWAGVKLKLKHFGFVLLSGLLGLFLELALVQKVL